ncbi:MULTISPECIES: hypothetical protein [unclassified Saccharicrinis]|uniref:hypothetical protein n=1 Tax=unclassified Saccharicrinis TaxID=2646859 RepID=UPI003D355A6B
MDKETLLNIIIKDISEIETLVKSFHGQQDIPGAFLDLTESKLANITEEFKLLKHINGAEATTAPVKTLTVAATPVEETPQVVEPEQKEEPAKEIINPEPITKKTVAEEKQAIEIPQDVSKEDKPEIIEQADSKFENIEAKPGDNPKTIGESLVSEKKSVNELIANTQVSTIQKPLKGKPIQDLTKGLGINDRFMFQRELFGGKIEVLNQTLQQLNDMPDFITAQSFIQSNFNWDEEQEVTKAFFSYIERKF